MPKKRSANTQQPSTRSKLMRGLFVLGLWGGIAITIFTAFAALTLPDLREVEEFRRKPSITVLAADGRTLAEFGEKSASPVRLKNLPPHLINAVLAVEDRRFYSHYGFDPIGMARGVIINPIIGRRMAGGSTITQQLAKNLFLTPDRTAYRKVQELLLALWMESKYSKDQILEAYLSRAYFGAGAYGVEAASRIYFGKSASRVTIREAALLAGLLKAPSRYSPTNDPDEAASRTRVVLDAMHDAGFLTDAEKSSLDKMPPLNKQRLAIGGEGRYFADWVVAQARDLVGDVAADLIITTTLDRRTQQAAEKIVTSLLDKEGTNAKASQAALVLLNEAGGVAALVGGRDYQDSQFNRATMAQRQPGSSFKPVVYLAAMMNGATPNDVRVDAPRRYGKWQPDNYDGKFRGEITLRQALAESVNTISVQLASEVGIERVRRLAQRMGITGDLPRDLSLALGSATVTPLDMAAAYAVFANAGQAVAPYAITEIKTASGEVLYQHRAVAMPQIAPAASVAQVSSMLEDVITYGTGQGAALGRPAAGKTGTSSDYRDAWFAGYTHDHTLVVWVGNDNNQPMRRVTGGGIPARIWRGVMSAAAAELPAQPLRAAAFMPGPGAGLLQDAAQLFGIGNNAEPIGAAAPAPQNILRLPAPSAESPAAIIDNSVPAANDNPAPAAAPDAPPAYNQQTSDELNSVLKRVLGN